MKFVFRNDSGEKIHCNLEKNGSKILAVMAHGFKGDKELLIFKKLEEDLKNLNIDSLRIDFSGSGESEGDYSASTIKKQTDELNLAIKKLGYRKVVLIGHSMGCSTSLIVAAKNHSIQGMIFISPLVFPLITFSDSMLKFSPYVFLHNLNPEKFKLFDRFELAKNSKKKIKSLIKKEVMGKKMSEEIKTLDLICLAKKISIPTLIICGKFDQLIPLSHTEYLKNVMPKSELVIVNSFHTPFEKNQVAEISKYALNFAKKLKEKFLK